MAGVGICLCIASRVQHIIASPLLYCRSPLLAIQYAYRHSINRKLTQHGETEAMPPLQATSLTHCLPYPAYKTATDTRIITGRGRLHLKTKLFYRPLWRFVAAIQVIEGGV